jgi:hypothetical protein
MHLFIQLCWLQQEIHPIKRNQAICERGDPITNMNFITELF